MHHCNIRDIINSEHIVLVKKTYYKFHCYESEASEQIHILSNSWSSTFNAVHFNEKSFQMPGQKKTKGLKGFKVRSFIGRFQTAWQGRC